MQPLDRIVFATPSVRVGAFRCPVSDPRFPDSGPTEGHLVVFPRSGVWIQQAGSRPIAAEPRVVTIYNRHREYRRAPIAAEGDRSDWYSVAPDLALAIAREHDPAVGDDPDRAFRFEAATSDAQLFWRQRWLFLALERGTLSRLQAEEEVLRLVGRVLAVAAGRRWNGGGSGRRAAQARLDLVEQARAELARCIAEPTTIATLAARLETSPYHLCRVFRAGTGLTLHQYRVELRLRAALERLAEPGLSLSRLAHDLGFSSHSHFSAVLRRRFGRTPTQCRDALRAPRRTGIRLH